MNSANTLGYTGAFLDVVAAAYPLGHGYRVYLPCLMRFSAPDDESPFGPGGVNCYAYCAADPINNTDPSGRFPEHGIDIALDALTSTRPLQPLSADEIDGELNALAPRHPSADEASAAAPAHAGPDMPWMDNAAAARANRRAPGRGGRKRKWSESAMAAMAALPPPLEIDELPTDHAGYTRLITDAYHLGQLKVVPYDDEESVDIFEWRANIKLKGEPLDIRDRRLADLMKNGYGASRVHNVRDPNVPFRLRVEHPYPRRLLINIALGGPVPGPGGFRLIRLRPSYSLSRFPKRMYTRFFESALDRLITSLY